jgi:hypothetical protein
VIVVGIALALILMHSIARLEDGPDAAGSTLMTDLLLFALCLAGVIHAKRKREEESDD